MSERKTQVYDQIEEHLARWKPEEDWPGNYWVEIDLLTTNDLSTVQFHGGLFHVPNLKNTNQRKRGCRVLKENGLVIREKGEEYIIAYDWEMSTDGAYQILANIIKEVYQARWEDIEEVREIKI